MANKIRKPGFYWVRYKEWIVAEWDGTNWTVTHNCANYDDNDWAEINECALDEPVHDASALPIPDVSQQSELLIDFINWYDQLGKDLFDEDGYDILVNHYLKSINCG